MITFNVGDKVLHSTVGFSGITKIWVVKNVSTWGEVIGVQGYSDPTPAYQLDDGSWVHEQYLKPADLQSTSHELLNQPN